uniref:phosphoribosyltransferase n=1 Tax=Sporichthya sp. TaxID=65475 RepID=UPI0017ACF44D
VLGYAETATGLGHAVADALRTARYLHSTRRAVAGVAPVAGFDEEHSHAVAHLLLPADPNLLAGGEPLVLVDDELSTGSTVLNTVTALQSRHPRSRYVVATLLDLRSPADRERMARTADALHTRIDVVALASGRLELRADVLERGTALVADALAASKPPPAGGPRAHVSELELPWPPGLAPDARHGCDPADRGTWDTALPLMARQIAGAVWPAAPTGRSTARTVLVLGVEELIHVPVRLAVSLAEDAEAVGREVEVRASSTTRSPVLGLDVPGYAIRHAMTFPAHDAPSDGPGPRYAYNLLGPAGARRFDAIVLVLDAPADTPALRAGGGLLEQLRGVCEHLVVVTAPQPVTKPAARRTERTAPPEPLHGPAFGSYDAAEVGWLLTDLSHIPLEAPLAQREAAVQSGRAHYAESLPIEYVPGAAYLEMFERSLQLSAARVAHAVGLVTEAVLARRGERTVLVSLARAGTPVGILMRRWAQQVARTELPHYAVSIVRGRGIDTVALQWLTDHHHPADVVFVDGWTGKGAIARELTAALTAYAGAGGAHFDSDLAVLADPGWAAPLAGTRDDFLIPSACLNSTVSGLVSRTVLRADLIGPNDFHGAKFYRDLGDGDVSARFLDAVAAEFTTVAPAVRDDVRQGGAGKRPVTWRGWAAVEKICADEGIADVNLVKPGVGETTRVLLRRVPHKVLARADAGADLDHIRLLADERGVPVETVDNLPYSCVGLIAAGAGGDS